MITEAEFIHKCEFTCPICKAMIRPSGMVDAYSDILNKGGEEKADEIIAETVEDMQKQHFRLHAVERMLREKGIVGDDIEKLEKDVTAAISLTRLEQRFGKAKIQFG
jgi:hypothetical protein